MKLTVLIVNWNTRELLKACLTSLENFPASIEQEVIVVDNASNDGSREMVSAQFPHVKLINSVGNLGYAKGNNIAFEAASGDYLLLLNPDTEVLEGTLDKAVTYIQTHPKVAALGAKQIAKDGSVQSSCRSFPSLRAVLFEFVGLSKLFPQSKLFAEYRMSWFDYKSELEVDQPMGTFLMISRAAYQEVGKMDERFPIFFNEVDWCFRAKKLGWSIRYNPEVEIIHWGGESTKQVKKAMIWESHYSLLRFYAKHYSPFWRALIFPAVYLSAFFRGKGWHRGFRAS